MTLHQILLFTFVTNWFLGCDLQAQTHRDNIVLVQGVYNAIQNENTSTFQLELIPNILELKDAGETFDRYTITLSTIIQSKWQQVTVGNLHLQETHGGVVMATGEFIGRQVTECDIIISRFQHAWVIKNGKIIGFKKEQIK